MCLLRRAFWGGRGAVELTGFCGGADEERGAQIGVLSLNGPGRVDLRYFRNRVTQTGVDAGMAEESAACCGVNLAYPWCQECQRIESFADRYSVICESRKMSGPQTDSVLCESRKMSGPQTDSVGGRGEPLGPLAGPLRKQKDERTGDGFSRRWRGEDPDGGWSFSITDRRPVRRRRSERRGGAPACAPCVRGARRRPHRR